MQNQRRRARPDLDTNSNSTCSCCVTGSTPTQLPEGRPGATPSGTAHPPQQRRDPPQSTKTMTSFATPPLKISPPTLGSGRSAAGGAGRNGTAPSLIARSVATACTKRTGTGGTPSVLPGARPPPLRPRTDATAAGIGAPDHTLAIVRGIARGTGPDHADAIARGSGPDPALGTAHGRGLVPQSPDRSGAARRTTATKSPSTNATAAHPTTLTATRNRPAPPLAAPLKEALRLGARSRCPKHSRR